MDAKTEALKWHGKLAGWIDRNPKKTATIMLVAVALGVVGWIV